MSACRTSPANSASPHAGIFGRKKYDKCETNVYYFIVFFDCSEPRPSRSGNFEKLMKLSWVKINVFHIFPESIPSEIICGKFSGDYEKLLPRKGGSVCRSLKELGADCYHVSSVSAGHWGLEDPPTYEKLKSPNNGSQPVPQQSA